MDRILKTANRYQEFVNRSVKSAKGFTRTGLGKYSKIQRNF